MKVYAIHRTGKKLWYPTDDALLCRSVPRSEIAAISINERGITFPQGTFYLLGPDGKPKAGWTRLTRLMKNAKIGHNSMGPEGESGLCERETVGTVAEDTERIG
jgi:hypothetical protein